MAKAANGARLVAPSAETKAAALRQMKITIKAVKRSIAASVDSPKARAPAPARRSKP
jgi:hypothetical protein